MLQPRSNRGASSSPVERAWPDRLGELIGFVRKAAADTRVVVLKVAVVPFEPLQQVLLDPLVILANRGADVTVIVRGSARHTGSWPETARTLEDHGVRVLLADARRRRLDAVVVRRSRDGLEALVLGVQEVALPVGARPGDTSGIGRGVGTLSTGGLLGAEVGRGQRANAGLGRRLRWFNELTLGSRPVRHDRPPIVPGDTAEWARQRERAG